MPHFCGSCGWIGDPGERHDCPNRRKWGRFLCGRFSVSPIAIGWLGADERKLSRCCCTGIASAGGRWRVAGCSERGQEPLNRLRGYEPSTSTFVARLEHNVRDYAQEMAVSNHFRTTTQSPVLAKILPSGLKARLSAPFAVDRGTTESGSLR